MVTSRSSSGRCKSKTNFNWEGYFQRVKCARSSLGQKSRTVESVTRVSIKHGDNLTTSSGSEDLDGVSIVDTIEVARRGTIGSPDRKSCSGGKLFLFLVVFGLYGSIYDGRIWNGVMSTPMAAANRHFCCFCTSSPNHIVHLDLIGHIAHELRGCC